MNTGLFRVSGETGTDINDRILKLKVYLNELKVPEDVRLARTSSREVRTEHRNYIQTAIIKAELSLKTKVK